MHLEDEHAIDAFHGEPCIATQGGRPPRKQQRDDYGRLGRENMCKRYIHAGDMHELSHPPIPSSTLLYYTV